MACSYLNISIQKIHQNSKNGDFCEELLSENDFEAVLVNFCCYEYGANAETVQNISTRTLLAGVMPTHTKAVNFKATPMEKHM